MRRHIISRNIIGVAILIVGLMILLNALGVINTSAVTSNYWPLALVLVGVLMLSNNTRGWPFAVFLIVLGSLYQLQVADLINVEPWTITWSLFLIFIGVSIVFRRSHTHTNKRVDKSDRDDVSAILSGARVVSHSKALQQSNVTALMGGVLLDLREAEFDQDVSIDISAFWGGIEIIVPQNIVIRNQTTNIMGGTEDKTQQKTDKNSPVLTLTGTVLMAGVSIRNTPSNS